MDIFAALGVKPDGVSLLDNEADILRYLFDDSGWVVRFCVDVKRLVVRFSVWLEESFRQVECDIEVVK